jgi:hypothetical protein
MITALYFMGSCAVLMAIITAVLVLIQRRNERRERLHIA